MSEPEQKSCEVCFKYYLPEHNDELWLHTHASEMYSLLYELDQKLRSLLKYDDKASEEKVNYAEELREFIHSKFSFKV